MKYLGFGRADFHSSYVTFFQLQSQAMRVGGQIQTKSAKIIHLQKTTHLASSDGDTLIGLSEFVHPVHVNCEKER